MSFSLSPDHPFFTDEELSRRVDRLLALLPPFDLCTRSGEGLSRHDVLSRSLDALGGLEWAIPVVALLASNINGDSRQLGDALDELVVAVEVQLWIEFS